MPDHLDAGPLPASELAKRTGLHALTVIRSLRALAAFGAFQEISPDVFANTPVSAFFRDRPGGLRNAALFDPRVDHFYSTADESSRNIQVTASTTRASSARR